MKPIGLNKKRAMDALKKIHIKNRLDFDRGNVIHVSKSHPNYFTAFMVETDYGQPDVDAGIHWCAYISTYDKTGHGEWVSVKKKRRHKRK